MSTVASTDARSKRVVPPASALAKSVEFDDETMHVLLVDGRVISVPMIWFPLLSQGTPEQRDNCEIGGGGASLHWRDLDEDISVAGLLTGTNTHDKAKALEATVSYAQSLTQWALLIVAGTALLLVSTEYHRPKNSALLYSYFLFLPGWLSLIFSMYRGVRVQQAYLGYLLPERPDWAQSMLAVNSDALWQVRGMQAGVSVFGIWLAAYLVYWILFYVAPTEVH